MITKMHCGCPTSQVRCGGCCGAEALMQFCLSSSFVMQLYLASTRRKLCSQTKVLPNKPEQIVAFCYTHGGFHSSEMVGSVAW